MKFLAAFFGVFTLIVLLAAPRPAGAAVPTTDEPPSVESRFEAPDGAEDGSLDRGVVPEIGPRF